MKTYRQIIQDYIDPRYHSFIFESNIQYDFLDQSISYDLSQIIVKDYIKYKDSVEFISYTQHPSVLILHALRLQPKPEYKRNVPRIQQQFVKNAHQYLSAIRCIRLKAPEVFTDKTLEPYWSYDIYHFLTYNSDYLLRTSYGPYIIQVLSSQNKAFRIFNKALLKKTKASSEPSARDKLTSLKHRAAKRGLECTLSIEDVRKLLKVQRCYYTGKRFSKNTVRTFDRVDNSLGYIPGNVVACSLYANSIKEHMLENKRTALTFKQLNKMISILERRLT